MSAQVSENTKKPSSFLETTESSDLTRQKDEIWLLWKTDNKKEAGQLLVPLLKENPNQKDLLQLGILYYLDKGSLTEAKKLLQKYEKNETNQQSINEIKTSLYILEEDWTSAADLLENMVNEKPANINYRRDYAFVLSQLSEWEKSRKQYEILLKNKNIKNELIWDYRQIITQAADRVHFDYQYDHLPESLRQHILTQEYSRRINQKIRLNVKIFEELYTQRSFGATPSIREWVVGTHLQMDWAIKNNLIFSNYWEIDLLNGKDFHEIGTFIDHRKKSINTLLGYQHDKLLRSPVESFSKKGREDVGSRF